MSRKEYNRGHCTTARAYREFYNKQAAEKADLSRLRKSSRMLPIHWAVKEIMDWKKPPCRVLDVGCQHGALELALASLWYDVTAIDVSNLYVEQAKKNTSPLADYIDFSVLPVEEAKKLGMKFSVVTCLSVLEHVADFDKAYQSVLSVLKSPALLLVVVPIGTSWLSVEHTRVFRTSNLGSYFTVSGFTSVSVSQIRYSNDPNKKGWFTIRMEKGE